MRFYLYISSAKLEMLYPQIPHKPKRKVSSEIKLDLKVVAAAHKSEEEIELNRITMLDAVSDFLREYGDVGTLDRPGEYVEDSAAMRWGPFVGVNYERPTNRAPSGMVYFGSEVEGTVVALHGSMRHVIGSPAGPEVEYATGSSLPALDLMLRKQAESELINASDPGFAMGRRYLVEWIARINKNMKGPEQNVTFLAKRLLEGDLPDGRKVLIATPIYVALLD